MLSTVTFSTSESQFDPGIDNQGWWSDTWRNDNINDNYFTGYISNGANSHMTRNFFTFDLSSLDLTGQEVTSATLRLTRATGVSPDSEETVEFFDVSTPADVLNNNVGPDPAIYADLGSGVSYGSFTVAVAGSSSEVVSFDLNAGALADITDSVGQFFSIGGALTSIGQDTVHEGLFGFSNELGGQELVITTEPANDPPVAVDDAYAVDEDNELIVAASGVLANDWDPNGDALSVVAHTQPLDGDGNAAGTVVVNGDGSFTYTPESNFYGDATFEYTVTDGNGGYDTATVTVAVAPVIDAAVDVKPGNGDEVDPVNLGAKGVLPIVIYSGGADDLDATTIDINSIRLNDQQVELRKAVFEDLDGDGLDDLVLHFEMKSVKEQEVFDSSDFGEQLLTITAEIDGAAAGPDLIGQDTIRLVPQKGKK